MISLIALNVLIVFSSGGTIWKKVKISETSLMNLIKNKQLRTGKTPDI